jgi:Druantia protein DruA
VSESGILQGRRIGAAELEQIRQLLAGHPHWSRRRLSCQLAILWNWRNPAGQLKDMAARTLLLKLEQRGWISLPPRRRVPFNRMVHKQLPVTQRLFSESPITEALSALLPLTLTEVSRPGTTQRRLFEALLHQHHYLSHRGTVGENLQYLVCDCHGRPLACVLFGSAAWQCADRDRYVGWDSPTRSQRLHLLTNNTRFLIPAWVRVRHLASHILSRITKVLSHQWQGKYGHPIYLLETFVERDRFVGTSYQAANWIRVGQTKGRSRQDRADGTRHQVPIKDVYLCPLHPRFRELLQATLPT